MKNNSFKIYKAIFCAEKTKSSLVEECQIGHCNGLTKIQMNRHILSVHDGKKPFKCEICDCSNFKKETHE